MAQVEKTATLVMPLTPWNRELLDRMQIKDPDNAHSMDDANFIAFFEEGPPALIYDKHLFEWYEIQPIKHRVTTYYTDMKVNVTT